MVPSPPRFLVPCDVPGPAETEVRLSDVVQLIVNPRSGRSRSHAFVAALVERLRSAGATVRVQRTAGRGDAQRIAAELPPDVTRVVVVGGDGTVNEVADGLIHRPVPILIVPRGTENILAKVLRVRPTLDWLAAAAVGGRTVSMDVGSANGRRFLSVAGVGFDAEVVRRLERCRRGHITHLTYAMPIWRTFWEWRFPPFRVEIDGAPIFAGRGLVFVGNGWRYAIDLRLLRDARPDDGLLDVCIYPCTEQIGLLVHSVFSLMRQHVGRNGVIYARGRSVRISAPRPLPVQIDGELFGTTPVEFAILPNAARFIAGEDYTGKGT